MKQHFLHCFTKFIVILFLLILASCDILRTTPFEITGWTPGGGCSPEPEKIVIALVFSHQPDRQSIEHHFSFSNEEGRLTGGFVWEGKKILFIPDAPLEKNMDYFLNLAADAHDTEGLSLDRAFEGRFTTRRDNRRPALLSFSPAMNDVLAEPFGEIRLFFSQPVSSTYLPDTVLFSPSAAGAWTLEDEGKTAVFVPAEPWLQQKRYEIRVSESLTGKNGMKMGREAVSIFITGVDHEKPVLTGAWRLKKNGAGEELAESTAGSFRENSGWEKDDRLRLEFSKSVDILSIKNALSADSAPGLRIEYAQGTTASVNQDSFFCDEIIFSFESAPGWESRFSFRLKSGVKDRHGNESTDEHEFKIFANGTNSKPPALAGIRIPMAPGSAVDRELSAYGIDSIFNDLPIETDDPNYPGERYLYNTEIETFIECYFETVPGALIDILSVMELFRIDTSNNALYFSPRKIITNAFSVTDPHPGWEQYQRIEIQGKLKNMNNSGVVNILVSSGLKDNFGNRNEKTFRISLLK